MKPAYIYCDICGKKVSLDARWDCAPTRFHAFTHCHATNPMAVAGHSQGFQDNNFACTEVCTTCARALAQAIADTLTALKPKAKRGR